MAAPPSAQDGPLISALPPVTDYMTYLTLLEYQLTPQNLPTLNRLLNQDDGKLAEEIGWDLLKLVLPMMGEAPETVSQSLEIVARRGNPREVVVRVAEELEKMGDTVVDIDDAEVEQQDELPRFPGEAPRVHLGQLTLDGMSQIENTTETLAQDIPAQQTTSKSQQLQALFNMLSILHPRIKTQYPSRFLATSLPAALGAYRQTPITLATTSAFLNMLEKLDSRRRPALPPRASTQGTVIPAPTASAALLPDPEARAEEAETGVKVSSDAEKAIIARLLSAVLLEVLDEYMSSLATDGFPSMSWSSRTREHLDSKRIVPRRTTEIEQWKKMPELVQRDALMAHFYSISKDMQLDTSHETKRLIHEDEEEEPSQNPYHEEEPSEYPTSPSQIPFPRAGVIYLHAYHAYINNSGTLPPLTTTELTKLIAHSFPLSATPAIPLPALQDSLLSLLYKQTLTSTRQLSAPPPSPAKFLLLISTLTQLFSITPIPALRDSAHHITTSLLHKYPDLSVRVRIIKQTLQGSTLSTNWAEIEDEEISDESQAQQSEPEIVEETGLTRSTSAQVPHPIPLAPPQQMGQVKAIGVDWLRQEFATWIARTARKRDVDDILAGTEGLDPNEILRMPELSSTQDETDSNASKSIVDLVVPKTLPTLSVEPSSTITPENRDTDDSEADNMTTFLNSIPMYISALNLLCIVLPHLAIQPSGHLHSRISRYIDSLSTSCEFLLSVLQHARHSQLGSSSSDARVGNGAEKVRGDDVDADAAGLEESRADIFALEDARTRAKEAFERVGSS